LKRVLFLPWSVVLVDEENPLDARQGAYGRQIPRYLSIRLEEVAGLNPMFAPYCAESEEGTVFVVSGLPQPHEELKELGEQYGVDYVVSGQGLFQEQADVVLQIVHVTSDWHSERTLTLDLTNCRAAMEELLDLLLEELDPLAQRPAETECTEFSAQWQAVSPFLCAIDRLMALEIGNVVDDPAGVFDLFFEALAIDPAWQDGIEQLIGTALDFGLDDFGSHDVGIEAMERLLRDHPLLHKAWEALGYLYDQQERTDEAVHCLEQAHQLHPTNFASHHRLGSLYRRNGRHQEAEVMFRLGLERDPEHIPMLNELGVSLGEQGRHQEAADLFQQALTLSPVSGAFYANLGVSRFRAGDPDGAEQAFQQGLAAVDPHWNVYLNYGQLLRDVRPIEWVRVLFQGIQTLSELTERLDLAGRLVEGVREWLDEGEPEEVTAKGSVWLLGLIESITELVPEHRSAWVVLSELYRREGRHDRALRCLLEVEASEADNVWLHLHIGSLQVTLGQWDAAAARFEQVLQLEVDNRLALQSLLIIACKQGRYEQAVDAMDRLRAVEGQKEPDTRHD